jgi:hypothetical protein
MKEIQNEVVFRFFSVLIPASSLASKRSYLLNYLPPSNVNIHTSLPEHRVPSPVATSEAVSANDPTSQSRKKTSKFGD